MKKMLSILIVLSLVLTMFSFIETFAEGTVYFTDGFEDGVSKWTIPSGKGDKFTTTTQDKKSGSSSLKVIDDDEAANANYYSKKFQVTPGSEYTLSVDIKVESGAASAGKVYMRFNDADGKMAYSKSTAGSGNNWINKTETHTAPENAAVGMVIISSQAQGTGTVLIDNVTVYSGTKPDTEAATPVTPPAANDYDPAKDVPKYQAEALSNLQASSPVSLGAPIKDIQILGSYTDVKDDGTVMFYAVTSGPPATFFAYDVNSKTIEDIEYLQDADGKSAGKVSYGVDMGQDGVLNITTQSAAMFFRYDTKTGTLKCYGNLAPETAVMSNGYVDSNDNYYFGTYPSGKLFKYEKATDKLVDLGVVMDKSQYVRGIGGYQDKIYFGSNGISPFEFRKYDVKTGEVSKMPLPRLEGKFEGTDVENCYAASTAGKYYFGRCKIKSLNMYYLCVFDMEKEEWVDAIPRTLHMHTTELVDGIVYFHNTLEGNATLRGLFTYNPETKEVKRVEGIETKDMEYLIAPKLVTLKDQANYPGKTIVAGAGTKGLILINLENKKIEFIKDTLPQMNTNIRTLHKGINDELVVSAYMGSKLVIYDTKTNTIKNEPKIQQIENIEVIDNKYYLGRYGSEAGLSEYDPKTPAVAPKLIGNMNGLDQDRVFNIADAGGKIIWGSYPDYGLLGGAVAVYDKAQKKVTGLYKEPVKNQCIAGLAYRNGKIYGSTSVYGGLGSTAIDAPAQIFIMDVNTGKVEKSVEVKLSTDSNKQYFVGDMLFDSEGNLWVACAKTLIKVNPETLAIEKEITIGNLVNKIDKTRALPYCMEIGPDGLLYTNIGGVISAVDLKTYEVKTLYNKSTNAITVCDDGNLYMISNANINYLEKIYLSRKPSSGNQKYDKVANGSIALKIGSSKALINGETRLIDPNNDKVIADTVNGRTLVPVRFLAESLGAQVEWNDKTQTVTLTLPGKTVKIVLGVNEINIDGKIITIDVPAQTIEGRTMLPLRAFVESVMGKTIFWDDRGLIVITDNAVLDNTADADVISKIIGLF